MTGDKPHDMEVQNAAPMASAPTTGTAEGRNVWTTIAIVVAIPVLVLLVYHAFRFAGLTNADALDFAQVGRNVADGKGFTTYVIRPLALTHAATDPVRQPDTVHGPLHPFLLALVFGVMGPRDVSVSLVSSLFYLLTMPLLYRLGVRMFGVPTARIATMVFALNPLVLDYSSSGLPIALSTFLLTWLFLMLYTLVPAQAPVEAGVVRAVPFGRLAGAGVVAGMLYLADPLYVWILPALAAAFAGVQRPARALAVLAFCLPLVVVMAPWMIRNGMLTGNPVFGLRGAEVWMDTTVYPGALGYRMLPADLKPTAELFQAFIQKLLLGVGQVLAALPRLAPVWALAFLLPSLPFELKDAGAGRLRRAFLLSFVSLSVGMITFSVQPALLLCLLPMALLFSTAYLLHILQQARLTGSGLALAYALVAGVTLYPLFTDLALTPKAHTHPLAVSARLFGLRAAPGDLCLSDQPWSIAWYASRPAVWAPARDEQMPELVKRAPGLRWMFLTEQARAYSPSWAYVYDNLLEWNDSWRRSQSDNGEPPAPIVIDSMGQPVTEALTGFGTVDPADSQALTVVVARRRPPLDTLAVADAARSDRAEAAEIDAGAQPTAGGVR